MFYVSYSSYHGLHGSAKPYALLTEHFSLVYNIVAGTPQNEGTPPLAMSPQPHVLAIPAGDPPMQQLGQQEIVPELQAPPQADQPDPASPMTQYLESD